MERFTVMLRILHIVNIMDRAGIETMLMNYYRNIDRNEIQFDFLTHRPVVGAYDNEIISMGGKVFQAPRLYPQNYSAYFRFMSSFFSDHPEYQYVHSHIDTMSAFPLYAAKRSGVLIRISHSHSSKLDKDAKILVKFLAKLTIPNVANVYCACGEKAGLFMYGKKPFNVINNAIDLTQYTYSSDTRNNIRAMLGLENAFVVGHVGRYCYIKNQAFLIEIFAVLQENIKNAKLILIGKGEDEAKLRQKARALGCADDVLFLVDRSDINELYQVMDVFVLPSLFEGLPVVSVEAQANGLPCILSDRITKEACVTDAVTMLSLEDSKEKWAKAIEMAPKERLKNSIDQLRIAGYDVQVEAKKLTSWYQAIASNSCSKTSNLE